MKLLQGVVRLGEMYLPMVVVVAMLVLYGLAQTPSQARTPPVVTPTKARSTHDSGWHMAADRYGAVYQIDLSYAAMNDTQQDDANRFAHGG